MARDADALRIRKWAVSGDVQTPEDRQLDRSVGWPADFSQPGGRKLSREVVNEIFRELSALGVEINIHGCLLEWDASVSYIHPALVIGSDDNVYASLQNSTGIDPASDTDGSHWKLFPPIPNASQAAAGSVRLASIAETVAGTLTDAAVTPAGVAARMAPLEASAAGSGVNHYFWRE